MPRAFVFLLLVVPLAGPAAHSADRAKRQAYVEWMLANLPEVSSWTEWQRTTGELPPDFDSLLRDADLPDPLRFADGRPVEGREDWPARRAEILELTGRYMTGRLPPKPDIGRVELLSETPGEGFVTRMVRLEFGPDNAAHLRVQLMIPDGDGPFPVLMNFYLGGSAALAIRRNYIGVNLPASDFGDDDTESWPALYPEYEFSAMARWAWAARIALDYLETEPRVDLQRVGVTGYSRTGKTAVLAAALDDRIAAVIGGSHGVGGVLPWRMGGQYAMVEGVESTTRMFPHWYLPRLRFFSGREDYLPVDGNLLLAAIAPRPFLIQHGLNDEVTSVWGDEQSYFSAARAYDLFGARDKLNLMLVPGAHGLIDWEKCLDWLDIQFGRSSATWNEEPLYAWDYDSWASRHAGEIEPASFPVRAPGELLRMPDGSRIQTHEEWAKRADAIRGAIVDLIGSAPPRMDPPRRGRGRARPGPTEGDARPGQTEPDIPAWVVDRLIRRPSRSFGWPTTQEEQPGSARFYFNYGVKGDLYYPRDTPEDAQLPVVIWLHGYSHPLGYMWVYRTDQHPIMALVNAGYAVLAYDQSGFGSRQKETSPFYQRYHNWSRLGRMVEDVTEAITALEQQPRVDASRVYLFGYTLGGMIGLHAAALDERIKGVVSINGFTPMRTDTADRGTGGVARFSHERSLIPRLGFFAGGNEARIPYDYDELLASLAPRPVLVVQPTMGRGVTPADVRSAVDAAGQIYELFGAGRALKLDEPHDITRLTDSMLDNIVAWMTINMK